jgi:hypothetical protein
MNIRLISSVTPEDEDRFAPVLLGVLAQILEHLSIPFAIRIETAAGHVFERSRLALDQPRDAAGAPFESPSKYVPPAASA